MRCTILCINHLGMDQNALRSLLKEEGIEATLQNCDDLSSLPAMLEAGRYDLLLAAGDTAGASAAAESLRALGDAVSLPLLFIVPAPDAALRTEVNVWADAYLLEPGSTLHNSAAYIALLIRASRAQSRFETTQHYIREVALLLERDAEGHPVIVDANARFLELERQSLSEVVGRRLDQTSFEFTIHTLNEDVMEVFESGSPLHLPSFFYLRDERREWYDIYIYKSAPAQVSIVGDPLSEMKRAHDKVEESRRYLQTILNAQKHIIYITDGRSLINTNSAFLTFFGYPTMYDFLQEHKNVCELFEPSTEPGYVSKNHPAWMEDLLHTREGIPKVRIRNRGVVSIFVPTIEVITINTKRQYVVILTDITELESEKEKLRVIAMTDALTGAANRFKFNTIIEEQMASAKRYNTELSIVMLDIDNFKLINDQHSHVVGDEVLKSVARLVMDDIRSADLFIRWGGEEFMLILGNTSKENAKVTAEKLRLRFENYDFGTAGTITSSFGVTSLLPEDTVSSLVNRADEALYQAKKSGRNCTKVI